MKIQSIKLLTSLLISGLSIEASLGQMPISQSKLIVIPDSAFVKYKGDAQELAERFYRTFGEFRHGARIEIPRGAFPVVLEKGEEKEMRLSYELNSIKAEDIESIAFDTDSMYAALAGSKGSFGLVVIRLKSTVKPKDIAKE